MGEEKEATRCKGNEKNEFNYRGEGSVDDIPQNRGTNRKIVFIVHKIINTEKVRGKMMVLVWEINKKIEGGTPFVISDA